MHIQTGRRCGFVGAVAVICASCTAARATTISGGTYTGSTGGNASGSSVNMGNDGGDGYGFGSNTADLITGGLFTGGKGGNATGGEFAQGGQGGAGIDQFSGGGATTLTITGGSFTGGPGGTGSGAPVSLSGSTGYAVYVIGSSNSLVLIDGGTFNGSPDFQILEGGTIEFNGTFTGGKQLITSGSGSFSGLLADNTTAATYTYSIDGGEIILEPEPVACAFIIVPGVMVIRRRGGR